MSLALEHIMVTGMEIGLGIKALKSAFDIAKEIKDLNDTTAIRGKIIEMQSLIMEAQSSAIGAREDHAAQLDRIRSLEEEVSRLKAWDGERNRYELKDIGGAMFVYMLKRSERGNEPPHWLCPNCFEDGKKSLFQRKSASLVTTDCPRCGTSIGPRNTTPAWID